MRSLRDLHISRLSVALLTAVSLLATYVIVSGGGGRSPAEVAALAALRQPQAKTTTVVAPARPAPTSSAPAASSGGGGGGSGASSSPSPSAPASSSSASSGSTGSSDSTGSDGSSDSTGSSGSTGSTGSGDSGNASGSSSVDAANSKLPKVKHVFEIALSTTSYKAAFGHGGASYLRSLARRGTVLSGYESLGSSELADNLASISGQPPNADTRAGCTTYNDFRTGVVANKKGIVPGTGCVYPETALTVGDQVSATGHTWRAYIENEGKDSCVHPNSNALDDVALPDAESGYDTRHNPFIYFHSLLDLGDCATDDLDLTSLPAALASTSKTATVSYIAPSACDDARAVAGTATPGTAPTTTTSTTTTSSSTTTTGTTTTAPTSSTVTPTIVSAAMGLPTAAACPSGPVGIAAENAFLQTWVPKILRSPAYRKNGVLVIAFAGDGVKSSGPHVRTGALVLSRYTRAHHTISTPYTPYSLLRSVEDMLRYSPLAKASAARSFAADVLSK